ncbi:MAG: glycosyl hydrolase [Melioribacteraceae bacterium]|nr:MAG: glycosyl hydrolase [Melioribacteraceae bacterium]
MFADFHQIEKILIIRLSSLGDIILTTPVIRAIKLKFPHLKIDFLVKESFIETVKYNKHIDTVHTYEKDIDGLLTGKYDLVLDLQNNRRSRKITEKLGGMVEKFSKPQLKKFLLVNFKINLFNTIVPISERYAENLVGINVEEPPEIYTDNLKISLPEIFNSGKKVIGICPGSKHYTKMWPEEYYKNLALKLIDVGYNVVIFGGNSDIETGERISGAVSGVVNLTNEDRLSDTVNLMQYCEAVVCNDSGMMHTATAARVNVVAIFGSTVREFGFAPFSEKAVVIENTSLSCRPCSHIGKSFCPKGHFRCMLDLTPEVVFEKLKNLLESHG